MTLPWAASSCYPRALTVCSLTLAAQLALNITRHAQRATPKKLRLKPWSWSHATQHITLVTSFWLDCFIVKSEPWEIYQQHPGLQTKPMNSVEVEVFVVQSLCFSFTPSDISYVWQRLVLHLQTNGSGWEWPYRNRGGGGVSLTNHTHICIYVVCICICTCMHIQSLLSIFKCAIMFI